MPYQLRYAEGILPKMDHDPIGEGIVGDLHEVAHEIMDAASGGSPLSGMLGLEGELEELAAELGIEGLHDAAEATLEFALEGLDDPVKEASKISCRQPKGGKRGKRKPGTLHKGVKMRPDKRLAIYLRDGLRCMYCDEDLLSKWLENPESVHLDHVIPRSKRGKDSPVNLITTCNSCNLHRSDKPLATFTDEATVKKIQRNLKRNVCLLLPLIKAWIIESALQRQQIKEEELQEVREEAQRRYPGDARSEAAGFITSGEYVYRRLRRRVVPPMSNTFSLERRRASRKVSMRSTSLRQRTRRSKEAQTRTPK